MTGKKTGPRLTREQALEQYLEKEALTKRMEKIRHKIIVLSGKGGVGKSTVALNLACSLSLADKQVGLLDIDIHGPSIPTLLGLEGKSLEAVEDTIIPISYSDKLKVLSIGFMLPSQEDAVIWRGPLKMKVIKQFLKDVNWGKLDYLIIDSPPGTGDEPLSIAQLIPDATGAIIVTTPQELALADVRKCITFCRKLKLPVLGVIENMSGFVCPKCGARIDIFKAGGGERMSREMHVPFLGKLPIDPQIVDSGDQGKPYVHHYPKSHTARAFADIIRPILEMDKVENKSHR